LEKIIGILETCRRS
jgi:hypothetical protein